MYEDESEIIFSDKLLKIRDACLEHLNEMLVEAAEAHAASSDTKGVVTTPTDAAAEQAQLEQAIHESMVVIYSIPLRISNQPRDASQITSSFTLAGHVIADTDKDKEIAVNEDMDAVITDEVTVLIRRRRSPGPATS